jgi:hypothetical protein
MKRLIAFAILLACVLFLWVRSYWRLDILSTVRDDGSTRAIASYQGAIHLIDAGTNGRSRPIEWDHYQIPPAATYAALHRAGSIQWTTLGFIHIETTPTVRVTLPGQNRLLTVAVPAGGVVLPFGPSQTNLLVPWIAASPYEALIIPDWSLALLVSAYPLWMGRRVIRAIVRHRRGLCVACGYDLRASGERCPECGHIAATAARNG